MQQQWWAYVIVGVLSIGAGVAIAGLPENVAVDSTIVPTSTTGAPIATAPEVPDAPSTTEAAVPILVERSELRVVAANGANISRAAARMAGQLEGLGYVDVVPLNGNQISDVTVVHHADGLELAAARLAEELGLAPTAIAPLAAAPPVPDLPAEAQLVIYLGLDLA